MCGPRIPDTGEVGAEKHKFRESSERAWDTYRDCVKIESKIRAGDIVQRWLLSMHNTLTLAGSAMEEKKRRDLYFWSEIYKDENTAGSERIN